MVGEGVVGEDGGCRRGEVEIRGGEGEGGGVV